MSKAKPRWVAIHYRSARGQRKKVTVLTEFVEGTKAELSAKGGHSFYEKPAR